MSEQIAVRIPEDLAERLDELVASGRYRTRAEAIRSAIHDLVERERRRATAERIAEGYRRLPQTDEDVAVATAAAISSIDEEPW